MSDDATPAPDLIEPDPEQEAEVAAFWDDVKHHAHLSAAPGYFGASPLEALQPPAFSFGDTPEQSDELLELILEGMKTATAGALWDYEAAGETLPSVGTLGIVLDGSGHPRALIVSTSVEVVPFDQVDDDFARAEGEGDRSLDYWRQEHKRFFSSVAVHDRGFAEDMPVVLERFELVWPKPD
ncbi:uncharacterized protein YhfF [Nocardioides albertanoniae]|uniref:Uncharacterized protein YhfF n=1 Tax=Nocardioides albertanoniae TaxID=1175486 RepID=A0A543A6G4_9ACTN|nr:ASCH domain-containing protein [Nocardioides albertanoniae]TQL68168.1 uncharacterized protein YhfF [Nocardioides albertanoniae]